MTPISWHLTRMLTQIVRGVHQTQQNPRWNRSMTSVGTKGIDMKNFPQIVRTTVMNATTRYMHVMFVCQVLQHTISTSFCYVFQLQGARQPKRKRKKLHDLSDISSVGITAWGPLDEFRFNMFMRDLLTERAKDIFRCKGVLTVHVGAAVYPVQGKLHDYQMLTCYHGFVCRGTATQSLCSRGYTRQSAMVLLSSHGPMQRSV